jgi:phospholipid/cholesterol/gamma-HCH transport system substrate-binding protein
MRRFLFSRDMSVEVVVGAFMVMVFLGLGYFTIILSHQAWFAKKYPVKIEFANVMGLRQGDNVVVRGMPVGKVESLTLCDGKVCEGGKPAVMAVVLLDKPISVRRGYKVTIVSTSILGGHQLQIHEGPTDGAPVPAEETLKGETPLDIMSNAAEVVAAAKKSLVDGGALDRLQHAIAQIDEAVTRVNNGEGVIGKLLSKDDTVYKDLSESVASLRKISERLEKGEGTLGKLLSSDDALYKDLSASVASLRKISERLEKGEGTLGKLLSSDDALYKDLSAAVASLRTIATDMEKGKGSLGMLMKDEGLYNDVRGAIKEVRAAVDDFRETEPVVSFSSLMFGAF